MMWLQVAVLEATGRKPAVTAHHKNPGPFASMAAQCLIKLGAAGCANANGLAVQLINDLNDARRRIEPAEHKLESQANGERAWSLERDGPNLPDMFS